MKIIHNNFNEELIFELLKITVEKSNQIKKILMSLHNDKLLKEIKWNKDGLNEYFDFNLLKTCYFYEKLEIKELIEDLDLSLINIQIENIKDCIDKLNKLENIKYLLLKEIEKKEIRFFLKYECDNINI